MSRSTKEWIGKNDDDWPTGRALEELKLRKAKEQDGKCAICTRAFSPKLSLHLDHVRSLRSSGLYPGENLNRESNLQALCVECHQQIKTPQDLKEIAEIKRGERRQYGIKLAKERRKRPMPKVSKLKIRGEWVPNEWGRGLRWIPPSTE